MVRRHAIAVEPLPQNRKAERLRFCRTRQDTWRNRKRSTLRRGDEIIQRFQLRPRASDDRFRE